MPHNDHILFSFLEKLHVPFTRWYLTRLTAGMPFSDTLFGISNILKERYQVECISLRIQKEDLVKLETPFIALLDLPSNPLVMVTEVKTSQIFYRYKNQDQISSLDNFFSDWNGTVLLAEAETHSREEKYWENVRAEVLTMLRLPLVIVITAVLIMIFGKANLLTLLHNGWSSMALLFFYLAGFAASGLLMSQSITKAGSLVERVCKSGTKKGCSKILDSKASKIFGLISWSDIGFLYFTGSLLNLLLVKDSIGLLFSLSVMAIPYTIWSIFYQWRIAKEWCPFCVSVQIILWIILLLHLIISPELTPSMSAFSLISNTGQIMSAVACFLAPALLLWLVIPYAKDAHELVSVTTEYKSLKYSVNIIESALSLKPPVDTTGASKIIFGNAGASFIVTVVTDLTCPHCMEAHQYIEGLLQQYREKIAIQVVFSVPQKLQAAGKYYNDIQEEKKIVIKRLIGIYESQGAVKAEAVFHQWYTAGRRNFRRFLELNPVTGDIDGIDEEMERHKNWCSKMMIFRTPTVFLNRYQLPPWYKVSELNEIVGILIV